MSENNNAPARGLSSTLVYAKRLKGAQSRGGSIGAAFQASWNPNFAAIISFALTVGDALKKIDLGQLVITPEDVGGGADQAAVAAEFGHEVAQLVHAYMLEDGKVRDELNRDDLAYLATLDYSGLLAKVYSQIQNEIPRAETAGSEFRSAVTVGDTSLLKDSFQVQDTSKVPGASSVSRPSAVQAHHDASRDLRNHTATLPGATGTVAAGASKEGTPPSGPVPTQTQQAPSTPVDYGLGEEGSQNQVSENSTSAKVEDAPHRKPDEERRNPENSIGHDPEKRAATTPPETAVLPGNHPEDKADGANTPDPVTGDVPSK